MRMQLPEKLRSGRVIQYFGRDGGHNGRFIVQGPAGSKLHIISDDGMESGWEQVSVSTDRSRCPNWPEMCFVKDLFWDEEERVIQIHPPASEYVKMNRYCLHLWKPRFAEVPSPPACLVGVVGVGPDETYTAMKTFLADVEAQFHTGNFVSLDEYSATKASNSEAAL